jgi:serine/threonine protein kinase
MSISTDNEYKWADTLNIKPKELGSGTYGTVYDLMNGDVEKRTYFISFELTAGTSIEHPNLLKFKSTKYDNDSKKLSLILIYKKLDVTLTREVITQRMIVQLIHAVTALNKAGYYHYDIKPENIFIDLKTQNLVLGDLGGCFPIINNIKNCIGTYATAAPELYYDSKFYNSSQTWAIGASVLMSYLVASKKNTEIIELMEKGFTEQIVLTQLDDLEFEKLTPNIELSKSFIRYCLNPDYKKRPTVQELLKHKYLSQFVYENVTPRIISNNNQFIPRKNIIHELSMIPEYSESILFTSLCIILNLAHYTQMDLYDIIDFVDEIVKHPDTSISDKNKPLLLISLLPHNSLYYSARSSGDLHNFILEYKHDPNVYKNIKPTPNPYRPELVCLLEYLK